MDERRCWKYCVVGNIVKDAHRCGGNSALRLTAIYRRNESIFERETLGSNTAEDLRARTEPV